MNRMKAPQLGQLLETFLRQQAESPDVDLSEQGSEVVLFQSAGVQLVDPRTAFESALEAAGHFGDAKQFQTMKMKAPPEWASLVRAHESSVAVPFCLGNFPQMIRSLAPLLSETDLSRLKPRPGQPTPLEGALERGQKAAADGRFADALLAAALLRNTGQFVESAELLKQIRQAKPAGFQSLLLNEEAALAWHRGEDERAAELWASHPNQDSPAIQFNRGLAAVFNNDRATATRLFQSAADSLPERSAWHHLARLYLSLAESPSS